MVDKLKSRPVITIIGSGYVGVTSAALFANAGYRVYALETNPDRLASIKAGKSFFYEEYLDPLLQAAVLSGNLTATHSYSEAIPNSDIVFSCVGTPENPDGSSNLDYVFAAASETAIYAKPHLVYVQKSTVPVGTGAKIETVFSDLARSIDYVSNPEFLRESTALTDSLWPERIVVGGNNINATEAVLSLYRYVTNQRETLVKLASIKTPKNSLLEPEYITTSLSSAELIKVTANAFLALKISFANSIAKLADASGADIMDVMYGVGSDSRIGRAFLNAGRGYGGGCFPKDVSSIISSGLDCGVELRIMQAARSENHSMPGYILEKALNATSDRSFEGKKVAVLGITFKAGTSDVRKSPSLKIANRLSDEMKADVYVYDPQAFTEESAKDSLRRRITISSSMEDAVKNADIVFVATDWLEFKQIPAHTYASLMKGTLIVDAMNCLDPVSFKAAGLNYIGVGR